MKIAIPTEVKNHEYRVAITPAGVHELVRHGHEVSVEAGHGVFAFGGAQLVLRDGEHYIAGSDPRKDGCAVGY